MKTAALILAAGRGERAGPGAAKQWRLIRGRRVIDRTLDRYMGFGFDRTVLVLHPDELHLAPEIPGLITVAGATTRAGSVRAGLAALSDIGGVDKVLIHDGARPFCSPDLIAAVLDALDHHQAAAPALAVTDALWRGADGTVQGTQDRTGLYRAQTPQGFRFDAIAAAHRAHSLDAADDVEIARLAGINVAIVPGEEDNIKLTWPQDFARAEAMLARDTMDIRVGTGFDVHALVPGDHVTLCGVQIPHSHNLSGHSDADVAMHAVTDAVYGALAQGDIGRHFPPSDPQWKGADSAIFLRHAVGLAAERGFAISNIDLTIICEAPKIGPHAQAMQRRMAQIIGLAADRISVKATTSERLGFTGRGEGIAAQALATLVTQC